jgi:hypothetical protein
MGRRLSALLPHTPRCFSKSVEVIENTWVAESMFSRVRKVQKIRDLRARLFRKVVRLLWERWVIGAKKEAPRWAPGRDRPRLDCSAGLRFVEAISWS